MTITAYAGKTGTGKSYGVVENVIIPGLKAGRTVVTNIPMRPEMLAVVIGPNFNLIQLDIHSCTADEWVTKTPAGAIAVIDEIWKYWPAGTTVDEMPATHRAYFGEHRHHVGADAHGRSRSTDIVILVQDCSMVCAFIRNLIDVTYRTVKLSRLNMDKKFRVDIYDGPVTGPKPPASQLVRQAFGTYKKEIYSCYRSHTKSETGDPGLETVTDNRASIWKSGTVVWGGIAAVIAPFLIWWGITVIPGMVIPGYDKAKKSKPSAAPAAPAQPQPVAPPPLGQPPQAPASANADAVAQGPALVVAVSAQPPAEKVPDISGEWRIVGAIAKKDGSGYAILKSATATRRVYLNSCHRDKIDADWYCDLDGERVTYWSGTTGGYASAAVTPGTFKN